jgi:hypothetical protein
VSDACASYATLENINSALHPFLRSITQETDFFSHYRLNLYNKKCPFWSDDDGMCGNIACAVNTLENEEDIPLIWRAEELGKLEGPKAEHPGKKLQKERPAQKPLQGGLGDDVGESCVVEYDDECDERDYCVPEDESVASKGDYLSLADNPERFTGYSGPGARQVWEAIYRENCFAKPESEPRGMSPEMTSSFGFGNPLQAQAAMDLRSVMKEHSMQEGVQQAIAKGAGLSQVDDLEFDQECIEKRVFYRIISGMHASISTHICYDFLNQTTGNWGPNLSCYTSRLHNNPERISNIYFNYALLLRAAAKLKGHLKDYSFCAADPVQDRHTKALALSFSRAIGHGEDIFDERVMFKSPDAVGLKEDFKNRFRNVSRIMDCVGCDKCRLWGKVQTNGYGTALKILFEFDETNPQNDPPLRRTELVALFNTLDRVSHSLTAIQEFRVLAEAQESALQAANASAKDDTPAAAAPAPLAKEAPEQKEPDGEDDGYPAFTRRAEANMTLSEIFWDEFSLVFRAFRFVISRWIDLPRKL